MPTTAKINITAKDKTRGAIGSVKAGLGGLKSSVGLATAAVAGLAGAAGMGALVRSSLAAGDALGKTADKLGATTKGLAGLRLAADRTAGATGTTLDTALQRMTRRVSEAALGTGSAKNELEELGLEAAKLSKMGADEQFKTLADAMQGVTNQGDRLRISMALFDTEGAILEKTLKGGSAGLEAYADQAERFGLAISRVDSAKMEAANDAISDMGAVVQGTAMGITTGLAPALTVFAQGMVENSASISDWAATTEKATKFVLGMFEEVGKGVLGLKGVFNILAAANNAWWSALSEGLSTGLAKLAEWAEYIPGEWGERIQAGLQTASENVMIFSEITGDAAEGFSEGLVQNIEDMAAWDGALTTAYDNAKKAAENSVKGQVVALKSLGQATKVQIAENDKWLAKQVAAQVKADEKKGWSQRQYVGVATQAGNALFENNKAIKAGLIVADTASAIMNAMSTLPFPANLAAAAGAAAMGAAQLSAARSAAKGGGSAPSAGTGGATGTAPTFGLSSAEGGGSPQQPTLRDDAGGGGSTTNTTISMQAGLYSKEDVRGLIEQINQEVGDGATLEVAA